MNLEAAWFCFLFPAIGALLCPILSRIHPTLRDYGAVFFSFLAAVVSVSFIPYLFQPSPLPLETSFLWLTSPFEIRAGVLIDPLSIVIANVVAVVSFIIMVYSLGYMKRDPGLTRFWMWMNLFISSMLLLVLSNNLLFIFIGWKLVGLCSYGLIGFYFKDEKEYWIGGPPPNEYCTPSHAALKALVVTSIGDLFMLAGILILFFYSNTLNLLELYETSSVWLPEMAKSPGMTTLVVFLLLAGPVGKSAQFPLHEWLPEAMAGPGPVSALIHAATMVKSGVYLVARFFPIFHYGYWVAGCGEAYHFFLATAWVGAFTALLAATQGTVSVELKKVLAYSTISQIGYMMLALGVGGLAPSLAIGGLTAGTFHLVSHALFKACLFLGAGSVIHTAHSIYMTDMGSLKKLMPMTWITMAIAALSLMGIPPLSGFWAKDAILIHCLEAHHYALFIVALITVLFTAFYTTRCMGMVFYGKRRGIAKPRGKPFRETHLLMMASSGILAVMIISLSIFSLSFMDLLENVFGYRLGNGSHLPVNSSEEHSILHLLVPLLSVISLGIGLLPAYFFYVSCKRDPATFAKRHPNLQHFSNFCRKRWYVHHFYYRFFVAGTIRLSDAMPKFIEDPLDRFFHQFVPAIPERLFSMGSLILNRGRGRALAKGTPTEVQAVGIGLGFSLIVVLFSLVVYLVVILIRKWTGSY